MSFNQVPAEVVLIVAETLDLQGINALQRCSRFLHHTLLSYLYKRDAQAGSSALLWAAQSDMLQIAKLSLQMGGDALVQLDDTGTDTSQPDPWSFRDDRWNTDDPAFVRFGYKTTALGIAAHRGSACLAQLLLEHVDKMSDIQSQSRGKYYQRLLVVAAMEGHSEVAELLLKRGADARLPVELDCPYAYENGGWVFGAQNAISCAAGGGYSNTIQLFIDYAFDINAVDCCNPLSSACRTARYDIVKFLIDNGADVNSGDLARNSPLIAAVDLGTYKIVKLVLDSGSKINLSESYSSDSPLEAAVRKGDERIVQLLLSRGALPDVGGADGTSPITRAAMDGHEDIVRQLIEAGADIDAYTEWTNGDCMWNIAIDAAVENGHTEIVQRLIEGGAQSLDGEQDDVHSHEPLVFAIENGHDEIARLLIKAGANVEKTKDCRSILSYAIAKGCNDIVILMIRHGAQVDKWNLDRADGKLNEEAMEALRIAYASSDGDYELHVYGPEGYCMDCGEGYCKDCGEGYYCDDCGC